MNFLRHLRSSVGFPAAPFAPGREPLLPWTRQQWVVLALLLVSGALFGWFNRVPGGMLTGGDDTTYLLLSRSLAAGHYRDEFLLGSPWHGQYPPGMPVWLLLTLGLGGGIAIVQALQMLMLALTGWLAADSLRRFGSRWCGVWVAGLVVWNPELSGFAGTLLSETLFTTLATVALWALVVASGTENARVNRALALAAFAALAAFLTRTIGVALLAAVCADFLLRQRWRWAFGMAVASGVVTGAWYAYIVRASKGATHSYFVDLAAVPIGTVAGGMPARVVDNLRHYVVEGIPELLALPMLPHSILDNAAWTMLLVGCGVVGLLWMVRRWPAAAGFVVATLVILLLWPWGLSRLAAPLLPVCLAAILTGARILERRFAITRGGMVGLVTALLFGSVIQREIRRSQSRRECPRSEWLLGSSGCMRKEDRALRMGAQVIRGALPLDAVIATGKGSVLYYLAGRRTLPIALLDRDLEDVAAVMHRVGVTHILLTRILPLESERLLPRLQAACGQLTVTAPIEGPAVLLSPRTAGAQDACAALEQLGSWEPPES